MHDDGRAQANATIREDIGEMVMSERERIMAGPRWRRALEMRALRKREQRLFDTWQAQERWIEGLRRDRDAS